MQIRHALADRGDRRRAVRFSEARRHPADAYALVLGQRRGGPGPLYAPAPKATSDTCQLEVRGGAATTVQWVAQTFLQLVLLSIIMIGQNV